MKSVLLFAVVLVVLTVGCSPARAADVAPPSPARRLANYVTAVEDVERGNVCYVSFDNSIFCLPIQSKDGGR